MQKILFKIISWLKNRLFKLLKFIELQLFITFFSWPILMYWGVPISLATFVGNLIFGPFLFIFLTLSSVIFFCEILFIPNYYLIKILELTNSVWLYVIKLSDSSWLISCSCPTVIVLLTLPVLVYLLLHNKRCLKNGTRAIILSIIFSVSFICFKYIFSKKYGETQIDYNKSSIKYIRTKDHNLVIDYGTLLKNGAQSWVKYSFVPELIKSGIDYTEHIIIVKPSVNVFRSLKELCKKISIKNIYMPKWSGNLNHKGWQAWQELLEIVLKKDITLTLINKEPLKIKTNNSKYILVQPKNKLVNKNNLKYKELQILDI